MVSKVAEFFALFGKYKEKNNNKNNNKEMSNRLDTRAAISALLDAGETPAFISRTLSVSRTTVYLVKNKKKVGANPLEDLPRTRAHPVVTPRVLGGLKKRIRAAPKKSLRRVAQESGINRESVQKVVVQAGWKSHRRKKVPLISCLGQKK